MFNAGYSQAAILPLRQQQYNPNFVKQFILSCAYLFLCSLLFAQNSDSGKTAMFSIHAQTTIINQFKPSFSAKYSGDNSLIASRESAISITSTIYAGAKLWKGASVFINPEMAGGGGLSKALGVADAPNGETFRIGDSYPAIYVARLFFTQLFSLSNKYVRQDDDLNQVGGVLPAKYFSITIGKIGIADYFDNNKFSHDPRTQFMNWGLMDNGAWDYPANTRGYTPSIVLMYVTPSNEWHYAISLVPEMANGNTMNWLIKKANSQTLEYTHRYRLNDLDGVVKVLTFFTTANMGNYRQSIAASPAYPDITQTRKYGRTKFGFGINAEQNITTNLGCFLRASWNDGTNETWAFTEIDRTTSAGLVMPGNKWHRNNDNIGLGFVVSGISNAHKAYLQAGGKGFMLGDGKLNYGAEQLAETYYSAALNQNIFISGVYQLLINPGYNKDRHGPVNIFSVRVHTKI